jgi:fructokinase
MAELPTTTLLIGEALVDRLPAGPVVAGAPLNVARHLQALGTSPWLVSALGVGDAEGQQVQAAMRGAGLRTDGLQHHATLPTGVVDVHLLPGGGHRFEIAEPSAWDGIDPLAAAAVAQRAQPAVVYFGTLAQRHAPSRSAVQAVLNATPALRYLDLNLRDGVAGLPALVEASLQAADWVKVNDDELAQLQSWFGLSHAAALVQRFGLRRLIVTRGAQGYQSLNAQGQVDAEGPGVPANPYVDTVGAGDAFSGLLLAAHLHRRAWAPSLALANRFAAALCSHAGAAPADVATFYPPWQAALAALPQDTP